MLKNLKTFVVLTFASLSILFLSVPDEGFYKVEKKNNLEAQSYFAASITDESNAVKKYLEPVVKLNFEVETFMGRMLVSSATGFVVKYDKSEGASYILTNEHFCEGRMLTPNHRFFFEDSSTVMSAETQYDDGTLHFVKSDPTKDLCLLKTFTKMNTVKLAPKNYKVQQMEKVTTIGAPNGIFPIILETNVANVFSRDILPPNMRDGDPLIMLSDIIFGGQSGSPVYNSKGKVIGVIFMGLVNKHGPIYGSMAIPISDVHKFLEE